MKAPAILLLLSIPALAQPPVLGGPVPSVNALPAACASNSFPNAVILTSGTSGLYVCLAGSWVFGGGGGGGGVSSVSWSGGIVSVANPTSTPAFTIAGTSGGIPYFASTSTWASSPALTANAPIIGGGAGFSPTSGSRSGNTTVFTTLTGATTSGHVATFDGFGNLQDGGGSPGTGTVTTVSSSIGLISVSSPSTTPAINVSGTSGGIPYFSSATVLSSSGALTAGALVLGGGAGAAPTTGTRSGTTTKFFTYTGNPSPGNYLAMDSLGSGNVVDGGAASNFAVPNVLVKATAAGTIDPSFLAGVGGSFGSTCNATITTTAGQSTIGSTCTLSGAYAQVFLNGVLLRAGSLNDYTISGNNILMDSTNYAGGLAAGQKITVVQ